MTKYIKDVCDDRFDAGVDAWRHLLIRARVSPHEEVRAAAELADEKLTIAISYLDAVETVSKRIARDEREAERNSADERQQQLDIVVREYECDDCINGRYEEDPTKLHCLVVNGTVDANTVANLPCGSSFEQKSCATCVYGDGEMPGSDCFAKRGCAPPEVTAWEPKADDDHPRPDSDGGM